MEVKSPTIYNKEQARRYEAMQMVLDFSRGKAWSFKELIDYAESLYNYIDNGLDKSEVK